MSPERSKRNQARVLACKASSPELVVVIDENGKMVEVPKGLLFWGPSMAVKMARDLAERQAGKDRPVPRPTKDD